MREKDYPRSHTKPHESKLTKTVERHENCSCVFRVPSCDFVDHFSVVFDVARFDLSRSRRFSKASRDGVIDWALAATEPRRAQDSVRDEALGRADRLRQRHAA